MIYGLYLSAQGAEAQALRQSVLANNLANAQTTAFKRDIPVFRAHFPFDQAQQTPFDVPPGQEDQTGGVELSGTITDFGQGPLEVTHRPFDVAVVGPGFFQVDAAGETLLTRNGRFELDSNETLVTADDGFPVLDDTGTPIVIPQNIHEVMIANDGQISGIAASGEAVRLGQIGVVEPLDLMKLIKVGNSNYRSLGPTEVAINSQIRQGVIEGSSADPVHGMVDLIETSRAFEMNMNLMQYQDDMLGRLLQSVAPR